jgi:hypothetical protein
MAGKRIEAEGPATPSIRRDPGPTVGRLRSSRFPLPCPPDCIHHVRGRPPRHLGDAALQTTFSAESIVDEAMAKTGLSEIGDDWFMAPLSAWASDLEQANLNDFGRRFMRSQAIRDVGRRLRVLDTLRAHPEIGDVVLPPIVHITGLERSGTTLLHNLLARHADARALLRWELMEPIPPPTTETYAHDPRIAAVQASAEPLRGSLLEHMHWVDADDPEECVWGFIDCVSMLGQAASFCMPRWRRFLNEADLSPAFAHYRRIVQLLTWRHPVEPGGFLVLKAPQIGSQIAAFADVFPEAHFVVTDRDPFRTLVSVTELGASIIEPFCIENPMRRQGPDDPDMVEQIAHKLSVIEGFSDARPDRITHVPYPTLVGSPEAVVAGLIDSIGLPADPSLERRISEFLAAQRAGRRAAPPSALDTRGLDHDQVLAEPRIARYCKRFAIEPERSRLTGHAPPPP